MLFYVFQFGVIWLYNITYAYNVFVHVEEDHDLKDKNNSY